jgi:acyl-CoA thioester hydrolase
VVANINANFIAPIYYPDEIVIQTTMERIGRKSFTLLQRAVNARTREVKCECRTIMVCYDRAQGCTILMPDDVRQKMAEFEGREF